MVISLVLVLEGSQLASLTDLAFAAILVFGTYKKNTFSAIALPIFFVLGKISILDDLRGMDVELVLGFALYSATFLNCFCLGAIGAVRYRQLIRKRRSDSERVVL